MAIVPIKHKRSGTAGVVPTVDELLLGEIAVNYADGIIYLKTDNDGVVAITAIQASNETIVLTGDVTGSGAVSISTTLANTGVTAGTYNNSSTAITPLTVDSKGRVTSTGSSVTITPAFSSITNTPTTLAGYGITDAATSAQGALADSALQSGGNISVLNNDSGYITSTGAPVQSVAGKTGTVVLAKGDVGLSNVDNTSDVNKPISTATQTALDDKAPLASPSLTGSPTAPTQAATDNSTKIATTAFVKTAVSNLVDSAPATLDTLNELAAALGDDPNFATTVSTALGTKLSTTTQFGGAVSGTYDNISITGYNNSNWDTAYSWGNHASVGYLTSAPATDLSYTASTRTLNSSTGADVILPLATTTLAGLMSGDDKTKLNGIEAGAQVNVGTNLSYTASTRIITSSTGANATLPLVIASGDAGLMSGGDKAKLDGIATNANNYSLPAATSTVRGGVELFSDTQQSVGANTVTATSGRTYGIQVNSAGQLVVNVPWVDTNTNTTYSAGTGLDLSGTTFNLEPVISPATATELASNVNLNNLNASQAGFYYQTANADTTNNNYPSGEAGSLIVQKSAGNATQLYSTYNSSSPKLYFRANYNTGYGSWQRVFADDYHPNADKWTDARTLSLSGNASGSVSWDGSGNATLNATVSQSANADTVDGLHASSFLRSDVNDTASGEILFASARTDFGNSGGWDAVGFSNVTNLHVRDHSQFWFGAGNGTWFTGTANTKSQESGLAADASSAHDLLITTMQSSNTYDRGITFAVDNTGAGNSGWRLGKWHSGDAKDSSKLVVDGQIFAKAGYTDEYDYYSNDYSAYYSSQGGNAHWGGDSGYGWNVPGIVSSSAIQIQSGNAGANARKPQIQFHQYGYGGIAIEYDGPNDTLNIIGPAIRLSSTGFKVQGNTVWHAGNDGAGSGLDADTVDGVHAGSFLRKDTSDTFTGTVLAINAASASNYFEVRNGSDTDNFMRFWCETGTAQIADTFADTTTDKQYIYFGNPNQSNDPGYIMHETSDSETNEGVLHLVPTDDNGYGDYVSIHGTNDADCLKLHTDGTIETASGYTLKLSSGSGAILADDDVDISGDICFQRATTAAIYQDDTATNSINWIEFQGSESGFRLGGNDFRFYTGSSTTSYGTNNVFINSAGIHITGANADNALQLTGTSPTISLRDTDSSAHSFFIHVNSNNFYILCDRDGGVSSGQYGTWEAPHPLQLEGDTNIGYLFGNRIFADNYHPNADKWTNARTLSLTGAVTGSASFDGSGNISLATTATSDPTLTLSGDASGSATFTNLGNATLTVTVANDSHTHDTRYFTETESDNRYLRGDVADDSFGRKVFYTDMTSQDDYINSPISIRERGLAGAGDGEDRDAPNLNFHWSGRVSNSLWMGANGWLNYGAYSAAGVPDASGTFRCGTLQIGSSGAEINNNTALSTGNGISTAQAGTLLLEQNSGGTQGEGNLGPGIAFTGINMSGGEGRRAGIYAQQTASDADRVGISFWTNNGTTATGSISQKMAITAAGELLIGYTSDNGAYKLQVNSQIFATSSTIATSDGRYKENVATLDGCVDLVKALRPVSFDWKHQEPITRLNEEGEAVVVREAHNFPDGTQVGFIAQEVETVLADKPWLGSIIKQNIRPAVTDNDGNELAPEEEFLGIAEGNLVAVLTSALQEAVAKIESLEARLTAAGL